MLIPTYPVFVSHYGAIKAFIEECITKNSHVFKIACLQHLIDLFPENSQPLYAGFGNRYTDARSYRYMGIDPFRIYQVDERGHVEIPQ